MLLRSIPAAVGRESASLDSRSMLSEHVNRSFGYKSLCVLSGSDSCRVETMGCVQHSNRWKHYYCFFTKSLKYCFSRALKCDYWTEILQDFLSGKEHIYHLKELLKMKLFCSSTEAKWDKSAYCRWREVPSDGSSCLLPLSLILRKILRLTTPRNRPAYCAHLGAQLLSRVRKQYSCKRQIFCIPSLWRLTNLCWNLLSASTYRQCFSTQLHDLYPEPSWRL